MVQCFDGNYVVHKVGEKVMCRVTSILCPGSLWDRESCQVSLFLIESYSSFNS